MKHTVLAIKVFVQSLLDEAFSSVLKNCSLKKLCKWHDLTLLFAVYNYIRHADEKFRLEMITWLSIFSGLSLNLNVFSLLLLKSKHSSVYLQQNTPCLVFRYRRPLSFKFPYLRQELLKYLSISCCCGYIGRFFIRLYFNWIN